MREILTIIEIKKKYTLLLYLYYIEKFIYFFDLDISIQSGRTLRNWCGIKGKRIINAFVLLTYLVKFCSDLSLSNYLFFLL